MKTIINANSSNSEVVTSKQLERINLFTRRPLTADEVFVFSIILCDNEIDRDGERFSKKSLEILSELFIGKTGIFTNDSNAENQVARIFEIKLVEDGKNSLEKNYYQLKAWAYMVRCDKNADLICEIEAGIKKEVSVGCAVERVICSTCGKDVKHEKCEHHKGYNYGGQFGTPCHHILENPTDAYEWSFVAVPAQKRAGVSKPIEKLTKHQRDIWDSITGKKYYIEYEKDKGFTQTFTGYLENFNGSGTSAFYNDNTCEFLMVKTSWIIYMKIKKN